jgi:hypothetical protein
MTPDDIYKLDKPSKGFLCPLSANSYDLVFKSFEIADYDSKNTLFDSQSDSIEVDPVFKDNDDLGRGIRYKFPEDVLKLPRIATLYVAHCCIMDLQFLSFFFLIVFRHVHSLTHPVPLSA